MVFLCKETELKILTLECHFSFFIHSLSLYFSPSLSLSLHSLLPNKLSVRQVVNFETLGILVQFQFSFLICS